MRYRPFGISGKAVSALSLLLRESPTLPTPGAWRTTVIDAMEHGINCFEGIAGSEVMARGFGEALSAVERRLVFIAWRIKGDPYRPLTPELISQTVRGGLAATGAGYFDVLMLDEQAFINLTLEASAFLSDLRAAGLVLQLGVVGDGPAMDQAIENAEFDVISMPFSLISDSNVRRRVKDAGAANMAAMAYDPFPVELLKAEASASTARKGLFRRDRANPLAGAGTYAFLHETAGWKAEEICFGYALTEPAFATVQVDILRAASVERLAEVTEKELPTSTAAQIEMARFALSAPEPKAKRA